MLVHCQTEKSLGRCPIFNDSIDIVVDFEDTLLNLDSTFGARVIWRFLSAPGLVTVNMIDVVCLAFCFDHPHWYARIFEMFFVEVENQIITSQFNLERHCITLSFGVKWELFGYLPSPIPTSKSSTIGQYKF